MIDVLIDGDMLDIPEQEVSIHAENFRFSDVLSDVYTTDIEIPLTDRNIRLLGIFSELDRGQHRTTGIRCVAVIDGTPKDSMITVSEIRRHTAIITIYCATIDTKLFDKSIRDILHDGIETIWEWGGVQYVNAFRQYGFLPYYSGIPFTDSTARFVKPHPYMRVPFLLERISTATGVNIIADASFADLAILATEKNITPQNSAQRFWKQTGTDIHGSQHVTNSFDPNYPEFGFKTNRAATGIFSLRLVKSTSGTDTVASDIYVNEVLALRLTVSQQGQVAENSVTLNLNEGDIVRFQFADNQWTLCNTHWMNYEIFDSDYGKELIYQQTGTFFGYFANIPDVKIRELLSSLSWACGKKLVFDGNSVLWKNADDIMEIEGEIDNIFPLSDIVGKSNVVEWANGHKSVMSSISGEQLVDEKVLHKSVFGRYGYANGIASIPQYAFDTTIDDNGDIAMNGVEFKNVEGIALVRIVTTVGVMHLEPLTDLYPIGTDEINTSIEVQGVARDADVTMCDYVSLHGREYMVVSADYDPTLRISNFKALLIDK